MNVIIANKQKEMLHSLDIEIIKSMDGEFEIDEIISTFQNFYFQKMILDITAIKNYKDIKNLQKLSISLDMNKVILLLDGSPESSDNNYLSSLISLGIYNFTTNKEGIMYLYNNPNSYRDVAHIHQLNPVQVQQQPIYIEKEGPTIIKEVMVDGGGNYSSKIIGIKNLTKQSGATTLVYMLLKELRKTNSVLAVEVNKRDAMFFSDKEFISSNNNEIGSIILNNSDKDYILVDINDSTVAETMCTKVVHLLEPSIIKLNKLMLVDNKIFTKQKDKFIIINQSLFSDKDVSDFEFEAGIKIAAHIPPLNEREDNGEVLRNFISKLDV